VKGLEQEGHRFSEDTRDATCGRAEKKIDPKQSVIFVTPTLWVWTVLGEESLLTH
jgi:hypothetical protein